MFIRRLGLVVFVAACLVSQSESRAEDSQVMLANAEITSSKDSDKLMVKIRPVWPRASKEPGEFREEDYVVNVPYVEQVEQTYTVAVPYTTKKTVDGKEVTETAYRQELRTRTVPVQKIRPETRTRRVPTVKTKTLALRDLTFSRLSGEEVSSRIAAKFLKESKPVLFLPAATNFADLKPFFKQDLLVLQPNAK
ncbi:MAG: hypothetical protein AAF802_11545 [Planctomycetota bacterium]